MLYFQMSFTVVFPLMLLSIFHADNFVLTTEFISIIVTGISFIDFRGRSLQGIKSTSTNALGIKFTLRPITKTFFLLYFTFFVSFFNTQA